MSLEGAQAWALALKMGGQIRAIPGAVLGWDGLVGKLKAALLASS